MARKRHNQGAIKKAKPKKEKAWYMYVLRCKDASFYCGVSTNPERRLVEHNEGTRGAKYTRSRRPCYLMFREKCVSKSDAFQKEAAFKKLRRPQKLEYMCCVIEEDMLAQVAKVGEVDNSDDAVEDTSKLDD